MGITYDAPSNIITVEGFTEETPCTFEDVYQADLSGGWGVVTKPCPFVYVIAANLWIDDNSPPTSYFGDENVVASFINSTKFGARRHANVRLGEIANESLKTTKNGCTLITDLTAGTGTNFIYMNPAYSTITFNLLGCTIMAPNNNIGVMLGRYSKCWNSHFIGAIIGQGNMGEIYHLTIMSSTPFWRPTGGTYEDITIIEPIGIALFRPVTDLQNLNVINPQSFVCSLHAPNRDLHFKDCVLDPWTFNYATFNYRVYRQYTFNLHVVDSDGNDLSEVTVKLYDKDTNEVFSVSTGGDGKIAEQTVSRGYYDKANGDTLQDYGPFTLKLSKTEYIDHEINQIILDKPMEWLTRMRPLGDLNLFGSAYMDAEVFDALITADIETEELVATIE